MAFTEPAVNQALANVLNRMRPTWNATAELTGQIKESKGLQIDILVNSPRHSPIVIENEFSPAATVADDARSRLGKTLVTDGSTITQVVELRTPSVLKDCQSTDQAENLLHSIDLEYALLISTPNVQYDSTAPKDVERIPPNPGNYLRGSILTFANFLANAGLNTSLLTESLRELDNGVQDSIGILSQIANTNDELKERLADLLMQSFADEDISQGLGIAVTVVINATLFQQRLSAHYDQVLSLSQMRTRDLLHQAGLIEQWERICAINYWPIFSIAISVLDAIDDPYVAARFISRLFNTTQRLIELGVVDTHDLCGVIFQRFMIEREFLASYYTRPESATLLAHLAAPDRKWQEESVYRAFKFADFSCGTGALVHSVYQRIAYLCEFNGGQASHHHAHMMEQNITAADIVPSAAHLTATLLSSLYPEITYNTSRVVVPQYGQIEDGSRVVLGSLELLDEDESFGTLYPNMSDTKVMGARTVEAMSYELLITPASQDMVIMNPPYTRAMSDWIEAGEGTWKPFRALGNSIETQQSMRLREKQITRNVDCYNGYQSMPSAFCGVADRMLKDGGVFAFVLPTTALQGVSWHGFRRMLAERYRNIMVVSIAGREAKQCAWSADTSLGEVLIIATKKSLDERKIRKEELGILVNLHARPPNSMLAAEYAARIEAIVTRESVRSIKDGPRGGSPIEIGGEKIGELISVPVSEKSWPDIGIRDFSLAQFAFQLRSGNLWFPREKLPLKQKLPFRSISEFATVGFADNNIANNQTAAFLRSTISSAPDFPMVWRNNSKKQRRFVVSPDQEGRIKANRDDLAFRIWARRSRSLIAREVSYSSQSLVTAYTDDPVIGGRGWPNVNFTNERHEKAFVLWGNSTLGVIEFWYHSSRQQVRRSIVSVTSIADLPWLDPSALSEAQLGIINGIFDDLATHQFLPLNEMVNDDARKELDVRLLIEALELPASILESVDLLRRKWCSEPSIQG